MTRGRSLLVAVGAFAVIAAAGLVWLMLAKDPVRQGGLRPTPEGATAGTGPRAVTATPRIEPLPTGVPKVAPPPPGPIPGGAISIGIYGSVVEAGSRRPLARARVAARPQGGGAVRGVESDAQGRFAVKGLPRGNYEVVAVAEGYLVAPTALATAASPTSGATLEIALERGLTITGRVVDTAGGPAEGATIDLTGAPAETYAGSFSPIRSGADGAFRIPGVPPGEGYRVTARAPGFSEAEARVPPVQPPEGATGLVVTLRRYRIAGRAIPADGVALPPPGLGVAIEVTTLAAGEEAPSVEAAKVPLDAEGRFEALVQRPGSYTVRAAPGGLGPVPTPSTGSEAGSGAGGREPPPAGAALEAGLASAHVRVEVAADGSAPEVTLRLERLLLFEGRTIDRTGKPLPSSRVRLREDGTQAAIAESLTDAQGRFRIPLLPRSYQLGARRSGFAPAVLPGVRPGGDPVDVTLLPLDGAVPTSGRFKGADGKPLAGVVVRFESGDDAEDAFEARVDREGNLEVSALAPGTYLQSFVEPGSGGRELRVWSRKVRVEGGRPAEVGFEEREARGRIQGWVRGAPRGAVITVNLQPLEEVEGRFGFLAAVGADGEGAFEFGTVPPGRYELRAASDAGGARASVVVAPGASARVEIQLPPVSEGRR